MNKIILVVTLDVVSFLVPQDSPRMIRVQDVTQHIADKVVYFELKNSWLFDIILFTLLLSTE